MLQLSSKKLITIGFLTWLVVAFLLFPNSPQQQNWVALILLLAPLFLVPLGAMLALPTKRYSLQKQGILLLTAIAFTCSYFLEKGIVAGLFIVPYLVATIDLVFTLLVLSKRTTNTVSDWCLRAAFIFLPIAPMWALADRLDWQPMGFDPIIVLLTAVHFHYAGFVLTLATSFVLQKASTILEKSIGWGVILGVPAVAIGITSTQFDLPNWLEISAVSLTASSAFGVALLHILKGIKIGFSRLSGVLFIVGGLALATGMVLAMLYGWRSVFPYSFLSIPWMYAVHGTLNSLGFALPILIAWSTRVVYK